MSIYDTSTLGTSNNSITFNDYSTYPIYRVKTRAPQQRQIRDLDIPIPFESGISDFETLVGKMAYVIEGKMYPSNESDASTGLAALRKLAHLETQQDDADSDNGYVPYRYNDNGADSRIIFLKVLYVDIKESTQSGLVQDFRLVCKIKDPTIYGGAAKVATTQGTDATTLGGAAELPTTLPVVFGASTISVTSSANNEGTVSTYPSSIVVVGPINTPKITNATTGEFIEVAQNLASAANTLTITYDKDSISVVLDGNSVLSSVSSGSSFFKLEPGANQIALTGSSIGAAYVTVNYRDAYALS